MSARCGAIILAAGQSRRMGSNKLLASLNGKPLVAHVAEAIAAAGLPAPIIVLGHAAQKVHATLGDVDATFVTANRYADGMAYSLAAGIAAIPPEWDSAIICLGDMPMIAPALLRCLAAESAPDAIAIPVFDGRRGNPVLWGRDYFAEIMALSGDHGAKPLFERHANNIREIPWTDDSIHTDIDTASELAALGDQPI